MKKFPLLFIIMAFTYPQATGFSIYGVGENIQNSDPASLSLGNSSFFCGNLKNLSTGSTSTLWRSTLTRFTIHSGLNYLKNTKLPAQYQQSLTTFSLFFPIGNKKVFGLGLQPVYRTNKLEISDEEYQFIGADESITGTPIVLKNTYTIDGGISELFFAYSQKLFQHFSGGIKYAFFFGNQYLDDELYIYDFAIDTISNGLLIDEIYEGDDTLYALAENPVVTILNKSRKFSGSTLSMEGRYTTSNNELVISASINSKVTVETHNVLTADGTTYTNSFENSSNAILSNIGFGYHYRFENNSGFTVEIHKYYPFNIPENAALFNIMPPEENSIHIGSYYQIINSKHGFWNNLNLRSGGYLKQLDFTGNKYFDYGVTFGIGLEYLANTQTFDLALRIGKRESYVLQGQDENYISFHFGITAGEKWFMKRRRK